VDGVRNLPLMMDIHSGVKSPVSKRGRMVDTSLRINRSNFRVFVVGWIVVLLSLHTRRECNLAKRRGRWRARGISFALSAHIHPSSSQTPSPRTKSYNAHSYRNAQYFRETESYPSRCDESRTLFGHVSNMETIMYFYSEDVTLDLR
jgi:hypothetical protein